ncbi:hypothetical protein ACVIGB_004900 [Bradyrhizobium sp. USDA 4341]
MGASAHLAIVMFAETPPHPDRIFDAIRPLPARGARWSGARKTKGAADCSAAPAILGRGNYFRLDIAVRSTESLAIPAAPHQLEPVPPGLIGVTLVVPPAVKSLVKALQLPFDRSVSE